MIHILLPGHLKTLAGVSGEVLLEIDGNATLQAVLTALEDRYPMLRGTIRDQHTHLRRPFLRFFACERDITHQPPDELLPNMVIEGVEPLVILGAIAGG